MITQHNTLTLLRVLENDTRKHTARIPGVTKLAIKDTITSHYFLVGLIKSTLLGIPRLVTSRFLKSR